MNNQHIWCITKVLDICDICALVAAITFEIRNFIAIEHSLQTVIDIGLIFDL
jgi:hypothetical protein